MKVFVAALPFLILATAFGSQVQVPHEPVVARLRQESLVNIPINGFHHPADCCYKYRQRIRCANMKDFFETSSGCSRPGIIFLTKQEQRICADPFALEVQNCIKSLRNVILLTGERGGLLEKK